MIFRSGKLEALVNESRRRRCANAGSQMFGIGIKAITSSLVTSHVAFEAPPDPVHGDKPMTMIRSSARPACLFVHYCALICSFGGGAPRALLLLPANDAPSAHF